MIAGVYSLLSLALFFFLPQGVIAQAYPKQAINLIIPLAPGDSTDVARRTIGEGSRLAGLGMVADYEPPDKLIAEIREEHRTVEQIAKKAGLIK
jgi:tripartite-type tricarboxylate transporter receptor subunit TctC